MYRLIVIVFLPLFFTGYAQQKYWVSFTDKDGVEFNPQEYFDQKAINRRIKHNVPLDHYSDRPLRADYVSKVAELSDTITGHSRWFNNVACIATEEQIREIAQLGCVTEVTHMRSEVFYAEDLSGYKSGEESLLENQTKWMQGELFAKEGITGKGIRVCVIDAGFPGVDYSSVFKHIREDKRIVGTWDFHKDKEDVYKFNSHGSTVLSCIGGKSKDGTLVGIAPDAEFLLARTERLMSEGMPEEEDWLMAIEWADRNGADIVNSSLGYTTSLYFKEDMDGQTSFITRAGNIAAGKGILVVNAAGNDGDGYWKYIGAPADADSVLSVGGINPWTGIHTSFSSFGPTADKRMKPNVMGFGHVLAYGHKKGLHETQGTSFASPLVAGFAACVLQDDTTLTVMELFRKIEAAGNLYPYFDYAHGFGVPLASNILYEKEEVEPTFSLEIVGDSIYGTIFDQFFEMNDEVAMNYHSGVVNQEEPQSYHIPDPFYTGDSQTKLKQPNYLYFHFEDENGVLDSYQVIAPIQKRAIEIPINYREGYVFRAFYKGYSTSIIANEQVEDAEVDVDFEEVEVDGKEKEEVENE